MKDCSLKKNPKQRQQQITQRVRSWADGSARPEGWAARASRTAKNKPGWPWREGGGALSPPPSLKRQRRVLPGELCPESRPLGSPAPEKPQPAVPPPVLLRLQLGVQQQRAVSACARACHQDPLGGQDGIVSPVRKAESAGVSHRWPGPSLWGLTGWGRRRSNCLESCREGVPSGWVFRYE